MSEQKKPMPCAASAPGPQSPTKVPAAGCDGEGSLLLDPDDIDAESEGDPSLRLFMYREALEARNRRVSAIERRLAAVLRHAQNAWWIGHLWRTREDVTGVWSSKHSDRQR